MAHSSASEPGAVAQREDHKLAPYNPTSEDGIRLALELAGVSSDDTVYDIGCGDGRTLLAAAAKGARGIGIEYDPKFVERCVLSGTAFGSHCVSLSLSTDAVPPPPSAKKNIEDAGLASKLSVIEGDAVELADLTEATVIFIYLVPKGIDLLKPRLAKAVRRGARLVSNMFSVPEWTPSRKVATPKGLPVYLYQHPEAPPSDSTASV